MKFVFLLSFLMINNCLASKLFFHIQCESDCLEYNELHSGNVIKISKDPVMEASIDDILQAQTLKDPSVPMDYLAITLNDDKAKEFENITAQNIGKRLAIVVNKQVLIYPYIAEKISGGVIHISFGVENKVQDFLSDNPWLADVMASKRFYIKESYQHLIVILLIILAAFYVGYKERKEKKVEEE